jgi:hypothetical protein
MIDLDWAEATAKAITNSEQRARALEMVAEAAAQSGDVERAGALAGTIANAGQRARTLASLAQLAGRVGDVDRAAALADLTKAAAAAMIAPDQRERTLTSVAKAAARAGDLDWGEALAGAITDPEPRARVLAVLARKADPDKARSLLARALTLGHWETSADALADIAPAAVLTIADQYLELTP